MKFEPNVYKTQKLFLRTPVLKPLSEFSDGVPSCLQEANEHSSKKE